MFTIRCGYSLASRKARGVHYVTSGLKHSAAHTALTAQGFERENFAGQKRKILRTFAASNVILSSSFSSKAQSFDYSALISSIMELQRNWLPSRIEEVVQYRDDNMAIRLRTVEQQAWLYISWSPVTAHIGLSFEGPPRGDIAEAFSFGKIVHNSLRSSILEAVRVPEQFERRAELIFTSRLGTTPKYVLNIEVMGRYSNLVLVNAENNVVMVAAQQIGSKMTSRRSLKTGQEYCPPPPPPGIPPDMIENRNDFRKSLQSQSEDQELKTGMVAVFQGISPSLACNICSAADVIPNKIIKDLREHEWEKLFEVWNMWMSQLVEGRLIPRVIPDGYSIELDEAYSISEDSIDVKEFSVLEFFRNYYGAIEENEEFFRLKNRLQRAITTAKTRISKKISSLRSQAADPAQHKATSKTADLIMANLHKIDPKSAEIEVLDWDSGNNITITLDSKKTPIEYAESLYAKARKQRRAVDQVAPLIESSIGLQEYLAELEIMVEQLGDGNDDASNEMFDLQALEQIEKEMINNGLLKPSSADMLAAKTSSKGRKGKQSVKKVAGEKYREFHSPTNLLVMIGRNSRQNDELTLRIAKSSDVWMHARGIPGAHVLLRVPPGKECADEDLQFAADLAAYYSKGRTEGKVEITCANPEHITKPRGAKPGQVLVRKEWVMIGHPNNCHAYHHEN